MITSRFITFEQAKAVLLHPEIMQRIAEDGADADDLCAANDDLFIGTFEQTERTSQLIGVWWLCPLASTTLDIHAQILQEHRQHKYVSWRQMLALVQDDLPSVHKMQARIPVCFPEVYHFAKKVGMLDEGLEKESKVIGGQFRDQWLVGNTVEAMAKIAEARNG
ncbi:hypothetical protein GJQ54_05375 [Oceanospirillaceae bacterium ASx5O]|nr:hypothetical protein GJQ54_05375 [Oceanospirillaceae bacterium ASx5O]